MNEIERRKKARQVIEQSENVIAEIDRAMRRTSTSANPAPPLQPTERQLAENPQQAITLNVEWVGEALNNAHGRGWGACRDIWQPFMTWTNAHPASHRAALDEVVTDPELRTILYAALDSM